MGGVWICVRVTALLVALCASPALAAELPPNVGDMLREAYPKERQNVVNVLKRLYPGSSDEIDKLVKQIEEQKKTQVERAGFVEGLRGEVTAGGYISTGNTKEWGVTGTASLKRQGKTWVHSLDLLADIKNENHERVTDRLSASYFGRRNFTGSNWFAVMGLRYERDQFAGYSRRFGQFLGGGYQLVNNDRLKWDVMAGPGFRQTRFIDAENENQLGLYARTTFAWQITDTVKFGEELSAAVGKGNDSYLSTTSVTTDIYGAFALRLSFVGEVETSPPPGRGKVDTYTRATVVYTFQPH
jgi:putative salt-induced outer membrane protein